MTELAHIRNDQIHRRYSGDPPKGWVVWLDGTQTSPPLAGLSNGTERVIVIERVTNDTSTTSETVKTTTTTIEANRVLIQTDIRDKTQAELDAEAEAIKDRAEQVLNITPEFKALATVVFELVNDVRGLKGQNPVTERQFKTALRSKM